MTSKQKTWLFRPASKTEEGGGHVTRSIALAQTWLENVVFSIEPDSPFADKIKKAGFDIVYTDQEADDYDGIFIDFYEGDFELYRRKAKCLMIIEDHRDLYDDADIYLRPYDTDLKKHENAFILDGLQYALIGSTYDQKFPKNPEQINTIAVAIGLYDSLNGTQYVLEHLNDRPENFQTKVILGANAKHRQAVTDFLENDYKKPYELIIDAPDLLDVFDTCDFVFSMGGTTSLEACACEVPSCALNLKDNQIPISTVLSNRGLLFYAGKLRSETDRLTETLGDIFDVSKRRSVCNALDNALDINGPKRVTDAIFQAFQKGQVA
jgi:spore coat polysaccharide biosynthesis predicted glycosyltransferase SpsG